MRANVVRPASVWIVFCLVLCVGTHQLCQAQQHDDNKVPSWWSNYRSISSSNSRFAGAGAAEGSTSEDAVKSARHRAESQFTTWVGRRILDSTNWYIHKYERGAIDQSSIPAFTEQLVQVWLARCKASKAQTILRSNRRYDAYVLIEMEAKDAASEFSMKAIAEFSGAAALNPRRVRELEAKFAAIFESASPTADMEVATSSPLEPQSEESAVPTNSLPRAQDFVERYNSGLTYAEEARKMLESGDKAGSDEKYREAIGEFDRALLYNAGHIPTLQNLGTIHFWIGDVDPALETFDRVYQLAPDNEKVLATLREIYSGLGNEAFQNALDAKGDEDPVGARSQLEAAVRFYDKAHEMKPNDIDVIQNRASVIWELADIVPEMKDEYLERAKAGYVTVHESEPTNEPVLLNLSILANDAGHAEEALGYAKQLVDLDPKNPKYHVNEGRIHGSLENKTDMFGGLLLGQALRLGVKRAPSIARDLAEAHGPRSEMLERYRLDAEPDEIRVLSDTGGNEYQIWFYWARGTAFAFEDGSLIFSKSFRQMGH